MVLKTEWVQLETIELKSESALNRQDNESANTANNDNKNNKQLNPAIVGSVNNNINIIKSASGNPSIGFGFGITGNKSTGVVVKAITIGGSAHKVISLFFVIRVKCMSKMEIFRLKRIEFLRPKLNC